VSDVRRRFVGAVGMEPIQPRLEDPALRRSASD
jgi:hypothetical protein